VPTPAITNTVIQAITLRANADVLHEVLSHGADVELWNEQEVAAWAGPMHDTVSPAAAEALARKAWDYYEARVNGKLDRLLHPRAQP